MKIKNPTIRSSLFQMRLISSRNNGNPFKHPGYYYFPAVNNDKEIKIYIFHHLLEN